MYPLGYVVRVVKAGEQLADSQRVINLLYQIPTRQNRECVTAAASLMNFPYDDAGDIAAAGLKDIRHQLTITIDPSGCKDIDDALTLSQLPTGGFLVGVHIADVGKFVAKGDVIDSNAKRRMMSFYAATRDVYNMLPAHLSEDVCSLMHGEDRCVVSVYLQTDNKMNMIDTETHPLICRSLIRNNRQMTYEEVQDIINDSGNKRIPWMEDSVYVMVVHLHRIAQRLRLNRLRLARHCFSEPDDPFCHVECHDAHQLIEEFMILTNFTVAGFLVERFPESVPVRRQKSPDDDEVKSWGTCHEAAVRVSLYFKQFDMLSGLIPRYARDDYSDQPKKISFLQSTIDKLKVAAENENLQKAVSLIAHESRHPLHLLAMNSWFKIQVSRLFVLKLYAIAFIMILLIC